MTRATTVQVNRVQPTRVWQTEMFRTHKRRITVNYRGILGASVITSVTASLAYPLNVVMSNLSIATDQKSVSLTVLANYEGACSIRVQATTDNDEVFTQMLLMTVMETPWVLGDTVATTGPEQITVSV